MRFVRRDRTRHDFRRRLWQRSYRDPGSKCDQGLNLKSKDIQGTMTERQENLYASILDRLIDDEPEVSTEGLHSRGVSMRQVEISLLRDLENLLNTRRNILMPPAAYGELNRSLYTYGLRDYTAENPSNPAMLQNLRREIAQAVALFEPRLKNVVVQIDAGRERRELFFRIVGTMVVEPFAEPVAFDIQLDPNRGEYLISR